jgi:hypothetical protein
MSSTPGDPPGYNLHFVLSLFARQSLRPVVPQRRMLMESVARIYPGASMLEREIAEIQVRLGTSRERSGDMDRAKVAAHTLSNMICAALLMRDMERLDC